MKHPMSERLTPHADATAFHEVLAQWKLAARTEVKRSSSLPSSMFDACDPMLEARLAESVEAMMNVLHQPSPEVTPGPSQNMELRIENVSIDELRALPQQLQADVGELDIDAGLSGEYLSLLIDSCTTADDSTQAGARDLLQRDFFVESNTDLDEATRALARCLPTVLDSTGDDQLAEEQLIELCGAIAATVILETNDLEGSNREPDET